MSSAAPGTAAVTYHRASTVDQNPTLAREELRRAASMRGLDLVAEIEEIGSGARNDRPGFQHLWQLVNQQRVGWVLCWKLDRFGRSMLDILTNAKKLQAAGVRLVFTSQGFEIAPGGGVITDLTLAVLGAAAELETSKISERTHLGLANARKAGKVLGRPRGSLDTRPRRKRRTRVVIMGA